MDKVIKMKATKLPYGEYNIGITEQPYIKNDFGNPSECFTSSRGFILKSMGHPAVGSFGDILFVRGHRTAGDNNTLTASGSYLRRIMHAVREYNSHLIIAELPVIPKDETFVIE